LAIASAIHPDQSTEGLYYDLILFYEPLIAEIAGHAAGTVSALPHLLAIGVEDPITHIRIRVLRRLNQQDLVTPYAEAAISDPAYLLGSQDDRGLEAIE
jgi:hypothetical protein